MGLESATYIDDLDSSNPTGSDNVNQGDDHIRLLKSTIQASFPNITGAMTMTQAQLNQVEDLLEAPEYIAKADVSTGSPATVSFQNIPAWPNKITMYWDLVSSSTNNNILVQLGTSSAWLTSGYNGQQVRHRNENTTQVQAMDSSGFTVRNTAAAARLVGKFILERTESGSNEYFAYYELYDRNDATEYRTGVGDASLSAALTRIRINGNGGNFDNGTISLKYEY